MTATLEETLAAYISGPALRDALEDVSIHLDRAVTKAVEKELDAVVDDILEPVEAALRHLQHEAETEAANATLDRSLILAKAHQQYVTKLGAVLRLLDNQVGGA